MWAACSPSPRLNVHPAWRLACAATPQVLMGFLHGRMVGEGNVVRHLEVLGYKVSYKQSPLTGEPPAPCV